MELTVTFLIEILLVLVLLGVLAVAAVISLRQRSGAAGTSTRTQAEERGREAAHDPPNHRVFFKSTGPGRGEEVKLRLYSPEEYRGELGGNTGPEIPEGTVAAVKASRRLADEWLDLPPDQAANALDLSPEDYEADKLNGVLLLKKMPPGMPSSASS